MSERRHALIWIDHREAKVFRFDAHTEDKVVIDSHQSVQRAHRLNGHDTDGHGAVDAEFYRRIVATLSHTAGTLLTGPGQAKWDLKAYIGREYPALAAHIYDLDTPAESGTANLVQIARDFFTTLA